MPSSVIRSFHYDAAARRLVITFTTGRRYAYFDVPLQVHESMRGASSRGTFFNQCIRDRYSYSRLDDAPAAATRRTTAGRLLSFLRPQRCTQE